MWILVQLLRGTVASVGGDVVEYRFPSPAGFDDWADVPGAVYEKLEPLYDEATLQDFAAAGVYDGHRATITRDGVWQRFQLGR